MQFNLQMTQRLPMGLGEQRAARSREEASPRRTQQGQSGRYNNLLGAACEEGPREGAACNEEVTDTMHPSCE